VGIVGKAVTVIKWGLWVKLLP